MRRFSRQGNAARSFHADTKCKGSGKITTCKAVHENLVDGAKIHSFSKRFYIEVLVYIDRLSLYRIWHGYKSARNGLDELGRRHQVRSLSLDGLGHFVQYQCSEVEH